MIFEHGAHALLIPLFGTALLERGRDYAIYGLNGLRLLEEDSAFRDLYASGVRVRFYGDYAPPFEELGLSEVAELCRNLETQTAFNTGPLLLIGLFAEDPYGRLAELSVRFASGHGRPPDREELVELYYGVPVPDLSLYIGYAQHALFDVPLIATGREDLYATLNPSPAMDERQLREILYDHLVWRRLAEADYDDLSAEERSALVRRVRLYEGLTLGVGRIDSATRTWAPLLPEDPLRGA
jgi:adenosine tuberculosinyltransferase